MYYVQGRSQGEGGNPPAETEKIVENCVISEGSIFNNKFSKINKKIQFFYRIFIKKFQNFPIICFFRPNVRKPNAVFVKFFEKYA